MSRTAAPSSPDFSIETGGSGSGRMGHSSHTLEEEKVSRQESEKDKGIPGGGHSSCGQHSGQWVWRGLDRQGLLYLRDQWWPLAGQRGEKETGAQPQA